MQQTKHSLICFFSHVLKIEPGNILANLRLGKIYQNKTLSYDSSIECYERIIQADPTYFKAFYQLGLIYIEKKENKKALDHFKESLKINPKFGPSYKAIGHILSGAGNVSNAIRYYQKGLELDPSDYEGKVGYANCLFMDGSIDEAINIYLELIQIEDTDDIRY